MVISSITAGGSRAAQGGRERKEGGKEGGGDVPALASSLHMLIDCRILAFRPETDEQNAAILNPAVILDSH